MTICPPTDTRAIGKNKVQNAPDHDKILKLPTPHIHKTKALEQFFDWHLRLLSWYPLQQTLEVPLIRNSQNFLTVPCKNPVHKPASAQTLCMSSQKKICIGRSLNLHCQIPLTQLPLIVRDFLSIIVKTGKNETGASANRSTLSLRSLSVNFLRRLFASRSHKSAMHSPASVWRRIW